MDYENIKFDDNARFAELGFKCGLEIHQQVATEKKLFCHCPVGLTDKHHDAEILRHMRPTLSELGEYDGTALMEFKTKKNVIYRLYRDRTCTYEMDDTPPFLVNQQAVDYAIRLALLFNCRIVDEIHVIRKQYLDGSIPTGFQRTMIIGVDGWVPYKDRKITITQVNLEEEACREISDIGHTITFAADRLSIPLVEIITDSQMKNPTEAAEVCRLLGNAMKVTGLVRRGIGTVRQDVNVSITGSTRVEIKGVHKVGNIKPLTAIEAIRHKGLLEIRDKIKSKFASPDEIQYRDIDITTFFKDSISSIGTRLGEHPEYVAVGLLLPKMADVTTHPLQPGKDFGTELSGRVRVIACIDDQPNLFFLSQKDNYKIPDSDWSIVCKRLKYEDRDDIALICGLAADVVTAMNEIKIRIAEAFDGVPNETRQDMKDGTTDFERILPGPDRMYPDTDHPPVGITMERVERNQRKVGEPLWDRHARWRKIGLHEEQVKALSLSPLSTLFDHLAAEQEINAKKAAHICSALYVGLRRKGHDLTKADPDRLYAMLKCALTEDWSHQRIQDTLISLVNGTRMPEQAVAAAPELEKTLERARSEFSGDGDREQYRLKRFAAGRLIKKQNVHVGDLIQKLEEKLS